MTSPTDDLARLRELSEKATHFMNAGNFRDGVQAELDFRSALAIWFRATHVKGKADE